MPRRADSGDECGGTAAGLVDSRGLAKTSATILDVPARSDVEIKAMAQVESLRESTDRAAAVDSYGKADAAVRMPDVPDCGVN